ncbi:TIR-like protein FxsC [Micromonospora sp. NPDC048894]|uniref:TIR-like protein FxsC n=2 Tax=Actinomycetes TaxID=1760 RepID=UPI0033E51495
MTTALLTALTRALPEVTSLELAEALWLAQFVQGATPPAPATATATAPDGDPSTKLAEPTHTGDTADRSDDTAERSAELYPATPTADGADVDALRVGGPRVPALPASLELARAMRPLRRRTPSRHVRTVDEAATADRIAFEGLWIPVERPCPEPRFNLAMIVDASHSMLVWRRTVHEFRALLQQVAVFRMISSYTVNTDLAEPAPLQLQAGDAPASPLTSPSTIIDPTGRLLIYVVTDGIGSAWHDGRMDTLVQRWAATNPLQIINVLPRRLWRSTALRTVYGPLPLYGHRGRVPVTVMELSTQGLGRHASVLAARALGGGTLVGGTEGVSGQVLLPPLGTRPTATPKPDEAVRRFFQLASPTAQQLAGWLAAVPLTLPIMRLVQQVMLPSSTPAHLAEVFVSGLLLQGATDSRDPELTEFDFVPGVRDLLLDNTDRYETLRVLAEVSRYVSDRLGQPLNFPALLVDPAQSHVPELSAGTLPVARIAATVLRRLGPRYTLLADRLDRAVIVAVEHRPVEEHNALAASEQTERSPVAATQLSIPWPSAAVDASEDEFQTDPHAPVFFLSYARTMSIRSGVFRDTSQKVFQFFVDLSDQVTELLSLQPGRTAGFLDRALDSGQMWTTELAFAAGHCQVFVPLISPQYARSALCTWEWNAFVRRQQRRRPDAQKGPGQLPIIPVNWAVTSHPRDLPEAIRRRQMFSPTNLPPDIAPQYQQEGIYGLLRLGHNGKDAYDAVVWRLAQRVVLAAKTQWVEPHVSQVDELSHEFEESGTA